MFEPALSGIGQIDADDFFIRRELEMCLLTGSYEHRVRVVRIVVVYDERRVIGRRVGTIDRCVQRWLSPVPRRRRGWT
jgi:hypothetical protein